MTIHGQKSYNGVAFLSRVEPTDIQRGFRDPDMSLDARLVAATFGNLRIINTYCPNGTALGTDKFAYKLAWAARLETHARSLLGLEEPLVLAGDYNVIPEPIDAKSPESWADDALFQPEARASYRRLINLGLTDALRACVPGPGAYTFWDYQAGAWQKNNGIRIDHLLLSPQAADLLAESGIDREPRAKEKASDHTPVWCRLEKAK